MTGIPILGTAQGIFVNPLIKLVTGRFVFTDAREADGGVDLWPNSRGSAPPFVNDTGPGDRPDKGPNSIVAAVGDLMQGGDADEYFSLGAGAFVFRTAINGVTDRMLQKAPDLVVRVATPPRGMNVTTTDSGGTPGLALEFPVPLTSLMVRWDSTDLEAKFEGGDWETTLAGAILNLSNTLNMFVGSEIEVSHLYTWDTDQTRAHLEAVAAQLP